MLCLTTNELPMSKALLASSKAFVVLMQSQICNTAIITLPSVYTIKLCTHLKTKTWTNVAGKIEEAHL